MSSEIGIRHTYPRLPLRARARAYIATARPMTLLAPVIGVIAAVSMAVSYGYTTWGLVLHQWHDLVYGIVTLMLVVIGGNFVNQATDHEDLINRPYRPVVQRVISRDEVATIGHFLWFFAILHAATTNPTFGALVLLLIMTSYAYSAPPLRLKAKTWIGNLGVAFARGLLGIVTAWTIYAPITAPEPWIAGGVLMFFLIGATTAKDYADEKGDRAHGVQTLVVRYGPRVATEYSLPFVISPLLLIPLLGVFGFLEINIYAFLPAAACILFLLHDMMFHWSTENGILEGTRPWAWMYFSIFTILLTYATPGLQRLWT